MNFSHAPRSSQPFDMSSATASVFGACRAESAARVEFYSFTLRSERLFGQAPRSSNAILQTQLFMTFSTRYSDPRMAAYPVDSGLSICSVLSDRPRSVAGMYTDGQGAL